MSAAREESTLRTLVRWTAWLVFVLAAAGAVYELGWIAWGSWWRTASITFALILLAAGLYLTRRKVHP